MSIKRVALFVIFILLHILILGLIPLGLFYLYISEIPTIILAVLWIAALWTARIILDKKHPAEHRKYYWAGNIGLIVLDAAILFLIALSCNGGYILIHKHYCISDCNECGDPEPSPLENCFPNYEDYVKFYIFRFRTEPQGATVRMKLTQEELCTTPCDYTFVGRPVNLSTWVEISKSGYETQEILLNPDFYEKTQGDIIIHLIHLNELKKILVFKMVYTPSNAKVFEHSVNDEETIICAHSPCSFVYEPDNGAQDLFFAADGYISQKISISEEVYSKSSTLRVDLKPEQKPKSE